MLVDVRVILLVEDNTMGKHLHPYTESGTLRVNTYVHYGYRLINKEIDSHITKNLTSLSAFGSILKKKILGTDVDWCEGHTLGWR
jgi:hypothetical protein